MATTDIREAIFDYAININNKILMLNEVERTMEEVFSTLTK